MLSNNIQMHIRNAYVVDTALVAWEAPALGSLPSITASDSGRACGLILAARTGTDSAREIDVLAPPRGAVRAAGLAGNCFGLAGFYTTRWVNNMLL